MGAEADDEDNDDEQEDTHASFPAHNVPSPRLAHQLRAR